MMAAGAWGYVAVMALATAAARVLPVVLVRGRIESRFARSFLHYVPYVTLSVMTFPAILGVTGVPAAGAVAFVVGVALAWRGASLFAVGSGCTASVLLVTLAASLA